MIRHILWYYEATVAYTKPVQPLTNAVGGHPEGCNLPVLQRDDQHNRSAARDMMILKVGPSSTLVTSTVQLGIARYMRSPFALWALPVQKAVLLLAAFGTVTVLKRRGIRRRELLKASTGSPLQVLASQRLSPSRFVTRGCSYERAA